MQQNRKGQSGKILTQIAINACEVFQKCHKYCFKLTTEDFVNLNTQNQCCNLFQHKLNTKLMRYQKITIQYQASSPYSDMKTWTSFKSSDFTSLKTEEETLPRNYFLPRT